MVDLVKIRKKAKEAQQASPPAETQPVPAPPSGVASRDPEPEVTEREPAAAPARVEAAVPEPSKAAVPKKKGKTPEPKSESPVEPKLEAGAPESAPSAATSGEAHTKLEEFKNQAGTQRFGEEEGTAGSADETLRELLTFSLAGENYAIDIENIVEITPPREVTRIPNADASVIGIISLRGTIVTVLDLRQMLGHRPLDGGGEDARIIVLERKGQTSGILVDRVFRVAKVGPREIESHPVVSPDEHNAAIEGVFHHKEVLTIVLNLERLLNS